MKYRNAADIFPDELLAEIRKYSSGELIYIPEESQTKKAGVKNQAHGIST